MIDKIILNIKEHPEWVYQSELANHYGILPSKIEKHLSNQSEFIFDDIRWFYNSIGHTKEQPKLMVIVDLSNVHDCLQKLLPYVESRSCDVRAYADRM